MLSAGTKLGPYEIVAPLGAGGLGEVYRARDTKLNRDLFRSPLRISKGKRRYFNSTAILSAGCPEAFSSACVAAPATRTSSAFAPG